MELVNPGIGLIFWMTLAFGTVFFVLSKFAWPSILRALKEREQHIEEALQAADITKEEMKKLKIDNEKLLREAKDERDAILNDARKIRDKMIDEARIRANEEADRIVESARERIENEKMAAMVEMKNQIAKVSIDIAEMILREKMKSDKAQTDFIERIIDESRLN